MLGWSSTGTAAQNECGVSILGEIQKTSGHSSEEPDLFDPALSRGVGLDDIWRHLPNTAMP